MMAGWECTGQPAASTYTNPMRDDGGLEQAAQQWDWERVVRFCMYFEGRCYNRMDVGSERKKLETVSKFGA